MNQTPSASDDPLQIIADLRRQLAERTTERDASEAQKAALTEVLCGLNVSPGDLASDCAAYREAALLQPALHRSPASGSDNPAAAGRGS
jgi:hypothetical protein